MPGPADDVDDHLHDVIDNLYRLMIQSHDYHGPATATAMTAETQRLLGNLARLSRSAHALSARAPGDLISYIEKGRNPDIYNREMVEHVFKTNQELSGRSAAWALMRDTLAREIAGGVPALSADVERVVRGAAFVGKEEEEKESKGA